MSSTIFTNPFSQEKTKVETVRRRGGHSAQPSPEDLTRIELDKHLRSIAEGKTPDEKTQSKFSEYVQNGNSYGYLDDVAVRTLFSQYVKKQISDGNADNLGKLLGPDSIFADYIERRRYKTDSIESQLFDYVLLALKQKKDGKDPNVEPVSLTAEGLDGFISHLTDKDKGLSFKANKLEQLRTSSDPMVRLLRDAATKLGLQKAIEITKSQLIAGESSAMTSKLGESLPELLKKETARLDEILPAGGALVVSRKADGTSISIPKIDISSHLNDLGPDASKEFSGSTTLDFGEFFRTAHKLSLGGDHDREHLAKHVSDGLSLILAYYKSEVKRAEATSETDRVNSLNEEFRLISKTIQGNGLLPTRLAKIIRDTASTAIMSDDFRNRASIGDINSLSSKLTAEFISGLQGNNREISALAGMKDIVDKDGKIEIVDPDSFKVQRHTVDWVETSEIKDANSAEENRHLSSNLSGNGSPISVERAVQAYQRTVDKACDKVYEHLVSRITGKENVVQKKTLENLAHKTEEKINEDITNVSSVSNLITEQIIAYKDSKAASADGTAMDNALRKFVEETLNITDGKEKSELWKGNTLGNITTYTPIATAVANLKTEILTSQNTGSGKVAKNNRVDVAVTDLIKALKDRQVGNDDSAKENSLLARFKEDKGKDRLRSLMSSLRVKAEESESLSKTIDLDKVVQIFDGEEGKKLQRALEDLSQPGSKFGDIKDKQDSEQFGEFATLLFAKDDKGGINEAKRLTALARLIKKAAGQDEALLSSITSHIVSKLKGNGVKSTDEIALALRLKKAVSAQIDVKIPKETKVTTDFEAAQAAYDLDVSKKNNSVTQAEIDEAQGAVNKAEQELTKTMSKVGQTKHTRLTNELKAAKDHLQALQAKTIVSSEEMDQLNKIIVDRNEELVAARVKSDEVIDKKDLANWIDKFVLSSQQRSIVLRGAFQNMQRQLDNLRGHFSAVGMRYFGDQQTYSANLRPAVDDITNVADTVDKDSPDAIKNMSEALGKNNPQAKSIFDQMVHGLKINPLKAPEGHNEHPGDIIDRIVNFLQNTVYSPVLSLWTAAKSAISGKSPSESFVEKPKRDEANADSAQLATVA
jgi:hypothetical protein